MYLKIPVVTVIDKHSVLTLVTDRKHDVSCETSENAHVFERCFYILLITGRNIDKDKGSNSYKRSEIKSWRSETLDLKDVAGQLP